jgi:glutamate decarboxylase
VRAYAAATTFDGSYEPVQEICDALDAFERETGLDIPVHVNGADAGLGRYAAK